MSSWVRTTTAVSLPGCTCASASSGQATITPSALGTRSRRGELPARVGDDRAPAELLGQAAELLRRVDRAKDEQARRRAEDVGEDLAALVLEQVTSAAAQGVSLVRRERAGAEARRLPRR